MKKIRFFINTMAGGGAEKVLINLLNVIDRENYDFTVVSVIGGEHMDEIPSGVKVRQVLNFRHKWLNDIFVRILHHIPYSLVAKICLKGDYDMEIAYLPGFPTRTVAAKKSNAKKIAFVHGVISEECSSVRLYKNKEQCRDIYKSFDKVCFVSEDTKDALERFIGKLDNAVVIHNVLDVDSIRKGGAEVCDVKYKGEGFKFIAVGRYTEVKAFDRLLRIAKTLEDKYSFELWIMGKGELRKEYEEFIEGHEVKSVKLLDFDKNPYKYMKQADMLVCSSLSEGYSTVAMESLILGMPVLTTDCAGMKEILHDGEYGLIVENSEDALKEGLEKILSDKELYSALKGKAESFGNSFSKADAVKQYKDLFEE